MDENDKIDPEVVQPETDLEQDYVFSRNAYHDLIQVALDGIQDLQTLAKDSEHPRAFEVLFQGIKHTAEINDKLVDLQRKMQVLEDNKPTSQRSGGGLSHQGDEPAAIAFEGTTKDLLKALDAAKADAQDAEFEDPEDA
jgi:hypothetical protein